jgi:hypothetical protein
MACVTWGRGERGEGRGERGEGRGEREGGRNLLVVGWRLVEVVDRVRCVEDEVKMCVALLVHRIERSILRAEETVSKMVCTLMLNNNGSCCQDDVHTLRPTIALDAHSSMQCLLLPFCKQHRQPQQGDEQFVDVRCMLRRVILVVDFAASQWSERERRCPSDLNLRGKDSPTAVRLFWWWLPFVPCLPAPFPLFHQANS